MLKSGGPRMSIIGIHESNIYLAWFVDGQIMRASLDISALTKEVE